VAVLQAGMGSLPHLICYAIKANSNHALLQLLQRAGCGFDAVSGGELLRALKVGAAPERVIVSGVGKEAWEIAAALQARVRYLCVESAEELRLVNCVAQAAGLRAAVCLRINPEVDAKTHPYISTGLKENKFGVPMAQAHDLVAEAMRLPQVDLVGISCHIGSQITALAPFVEAAGKVAAFCQARRAEGVPLTHIGIGGGLGVVYQDESPPDPAAYGAALAPILAPLGLQIVLEPGRVLVGNAGVLLTRVVRCKQGADRTFVVVDAGMNDLLRPALYGAQHRLEPVQLRAGALQPVEVVGPVCESADTFARACMLPPLQPGDALVLRTCGAYGAAMASTYNSRRRAAEVLCHGEHSQLIRQRDGWADLFAGERSLDGAPLSDTLPEAFVGTCS
jgi:diaminopimelate decarboxylase